MWNQIKELQERRAALAKESRGILDNAQKANRSLDATENSKFDAIMKDVDILDSRIKDLQRQYDLENSLKSEDRSGLTVGNIETANADKSKDAEKRAFDHYLRTGDTSRYYEVRAIAKGSNVVGPQDFYGSVVNALKAYNGVIQAGAEIIETANGNTLPIMTSTDTSNTGELVTEGGANATTADPTMANVNLAAYKFGSKIVKASIELVNDASFGLDNYLAGILGERLGRITNTYFTTGTGSSQPNGFITGGTLGKTAASATTFTYAELIDLYHSVDAAYRNDSSFHFCFNDTVAAFLRKMVDGASHYIWEPGRAGEPDLILGKPYVVNPDMDSAFTTGKKLVACGAFNRYKVRMVRGSEVVRLNELYAANGQVGYISWLRADGNLADATAIKYMALA